MAEKNAPAMAPARSPRPRRERARAMPRSSPLRTTVRAPPLFEDAERCRAIAPHPAIEGAVHDFRELADPRRASEPGVPRHDRPAAIREEGCRRDGCSQRYCGPALQTRSLNINQQPTRNRPLLGGCIAGTPNVRACGARCAPAAYTPQHFPQQRLVAFAAEDEATYLGSSVRASTAKQGTTRSIKSIRSADRSRAQCRLAGTAWRAAGGVRPDRRRHSR